MDDVEEILDAATHLQMRHIVNFCTEFLIEQVRFVALLTFSYLSQTV